MATFEDYYSANPVEVIDQNRWDYYSPLIAAQFHRSAYFSALMGYVDLNSADASSFIGTEAIRGHVNPNPIGLRQQYVNPMTWDTRRRELSGHTHYGQKIQMHDLDPLLNQWQSGGMSTDRLLLAISQQQLAYAAWWTMEHIAKKAYLTGANHIHYGPHGEYSSFADIKRDPADTFDLDIVKDISLRLSVRAQSTLDRFGTFADPVPGRPGQTLVLTTPGVVFDIWAKKNQFMVNLRTLQDARIMHGGRIDYFQYTVAETPWDIGLLWNAGNIDKQVAVLKYDIAADGVTAVRGVVSGDGSPDPATTKVWNMYQVGQKGVVHYIQCSPFADGDFVVGDRVSIHEARYINTGTMGVDWFGINYGCAFLDGRTQVLEIAEVDYVNNQLSFATPVMADYPEADAALTYLVLSGQNATLAQPDNTPTTWSATRDVVAYITKAQHIHPVIVAAARNAHLFAMLQPIKMHMPAPIDDFESITRITWNMRGAVNVWEPDLYEMYYVAASYGSRASVGL